MKIKKRYTHKTNKTIWRIIPGEINKLVIEERDLENKQVYFNCYNIESGKKVFTNIQLEEKFWIGIEAVYTDIIYFHKFVKPDMPQHIGIIAMDLNEKKILWKNFNYSFLFTWNEKVYCYQQMFEGKKFFSLDCKTGELLEEFGDDSAKINDVKKRIDESNPFSGYFFPEPFNSNFTESSNVKEILRKAEKENKIRGNINFVSKDHLLYFNFSYHNSKGNLTNLFKVLDLYTENFIFEETLIKETNSISPDSFFIKNDLLFLLFGKNRLSVYSISD